MRTFSRWHARAMIGFVAGGAIFAGLASAAAQTAGFDDAPTVSLTLSPAVEPIPALKYRLLPPLGERTKGNAALAYYRAVVQFEPIGHGPNFSKFVLGKLEPWLDTPLDKLPQAEVARALDNYRFVLKELERGARREECRWELPVESDGLEIALAEFQDLRNVARLPALRARLQMSRGDWEGALTSFGINYELGRNVSKSPLLITSLIGVAIERMNLAQLETFVQQPTSPNLYWALTELPVPLVDFRPGIEMEAWLPDAFPEIADFRSRRLSRDEARRLSDRLLKRLLGINDAGNTIEEARARFAASAVAGYTTDKETLIAAGRPKAEVEAMPVDQVVWLASYYRWQVYVQDLVKWSFLPAPQRTAGLARAEQRIGRFAAEHRGSPFELINLRPAAGSVLEALDRNDREIALLRIVEALRLYAHAHEGALPESLDKIDVVPIPADPVTGRPFDYRLKGETAVLETAPAFNSKWMGRRYVIRMRK